MGNFQDLKVWLRARNLAVKIYKITNKEPISKDFGFRDQIRRSAISIASNIAEGDELDTDKQAIRHFYIAKGSVAELYTQILIAGDIDYLKKGDLDDLVDDCEAISAMLFKLIGSRKTNI